MGLNVYRPGRAPAAAPWSTNGPCASPFDPDGRPGDDGVADVAPLRAGAALELALHMVRGTIMDAMNTIPASRFVILRAGRPKRLPAGAAGGRLRPLMAARITDDACRADGETGAEPLAVALFRSAGGPAWAAVPPGHNTALRLDGARLDPGPVAMARSGLAVPVTGSRAAPIRPIASADRRRDGLADTGAGWRSRGEAGPGCKGAAASVPARAA